MHTQQNPSRKDRRRFHRYDTTARIYFCVTYDLETRVEFQVVGRHDDQECLSKKYSAVSKNISVEAICFSSRKKLERNDYLYIEVYLPKSTQPIQMEGRVRWSRAISPLQHKKKEFNTGVKLLNVNGRSVLGSINYDEKNRVTWSIVLESIFGTFKELSKQRAK